MQSLGVQRPLEVSTKSASPIGAALSAFTLRITGPDGRSMTVESAYQGSKILSRGGPYHDLYQRHAVDAKRDERIRTGGEIVAFDYCGERWPTVPRSAFYDWLYISALVQVPRIAGSVSVHDCFSDISFNPNRSFNCQARSLAAFVSLEMRGLLQTAMRSRDDFLSLIGKIPISDDEQPDLFS